MTSCGYKKYYKLQICGNKLKLGKDVYIGPIATILCTFNNVGIADHVVIGPNLTIVENSHIFNIVGKYIKDSGLTKKWKCENRNGLLDRYQCDHFSRSDNW